MPSKGHITRALRRWAASTNPHGPHPLSRSRNAIPLLPSDPSSRVLSSGPQNCTEDDPSAQPEGDLRSRIFRLRFPKRSATAALDRWTQEGGSATAPELRRITRELRGAQRYKHALETCEWMITHRNDELEDCDYADRIELISRVFGVGAAEEFFEGLPLTAKTSETYTALLHAFARAKQIEKAESLFESMKSSYLNLKALAYNEMMTLYISAGQLDKVFTAVNELKANKVAPDLFTYNLWISASAASMDIDGVKTILDEMRQDSSFNDGWRIYCTLTEIYVSAGHLVKGQSSLIESGKGLSQREWITYDFLIILHSGLGNKETIDGIWKSLQMMSQKMTSRNYICILSSYLILGYLKEAGEIIDQWKISKSTDFDMPSCERLLDALVKLDLKSTAELYQKLMIQKDCMITNFTTSELQ